MTPTRTDVARRRLAFSLALGTAAAALAATPPRTWAHGGEVPRVTVWSTPDCACCAQWVRQLQDHLFVVEVRTVADLVPIRRALGVPPSLAACHTARIDGYVLEGPVPASDILDLLAERPDALGLAVPGRTAGAPGPAAASGAALPCETDHFDVLLIRPDGGTSIYKTHP